MYITFGMHISRWGSCVFLKKCYYGVLKNATYIKVAHKKIKIHIVSSCNFPNRNISHSEMYTMV
jgi:hypothetical protein